MAFNSPVWFNVGIEKKPQCSACFINSVQDTMSSIMDLAKTEAMLFKFGSGAGSNLSTIRSSREKMTGGGTASGPVSFMKGYDAFAGVVKSGGKTRRAAKMVILDAGHPDVLDFIDSKLNEEKKAWALIEQGYDPSFTGEAYGSVYFQNANHSVRVTDEFMQAVVDDKDWTTHSVVDHEPMDTFKARDIFRRMADAAWVCGDPGIQYDTTINDWHTSANTDRIHASNPCSEYMFLNDTACNLASLNLMKFVRDGRRVRRRGLSLRGEADDHRPGDPRRQRVLPDAEDRGEQPQVPAARPRLREPRRAADVTRPRLRLRRGPQLRRRPDRDHARRGLQAVVDRRPRPRRPVPRRTTRTARRSCGSSTSTATRPTSSRRPACPTDVGRAARVVYDEALELGEKHGYRNAQVTVLAPTGTIAFMMDCDTTGVEPDIALIKYKKLVGEGFLKIVNQTVPSALRKLGYGAEQVSEILDYINEHETIEGAPHLKPQHLPVFDCAFKPANGERSIHYMGHVRMMGAIQPFISGAISKTVNMPEAATAEEIEKVYLEGWKLGLKAIAIYRDNSKRSQPLSTGKKKTDGDGRADASSTPRSSPSFARSSRRPRPRRASRIAAASPRSGPRSPTSSTSPATRATSRSASIRTASPARSS